MQQKVVLLDELGEQFGSEHIYHNLRSPADAIKLLCINDEKFANHLATSHEDGVAYTVVQAGEYLGTEDLFLPLGKNDLVITPVIAGSGGGVGKTILGVAMVAAAIYFAPVAGAGFMGAAGTGLMTAGVSSFVGYMGVSLVLGGISQMIAPQPELPAQRFGDGASLATDGPQSVTRGSDGRQSYSYQGAANTVGVGATIPVVYGEVLAGSHLLSAQIQVADESDPLLKYIKDPGPSTIRIGGEEVTNKMQKLSGLKTRKFSKVKGGTLYSVNRTLHPTEGATTVLGTVTGEMPDHNTYPSNKFRVFFELPKGLFDYASGVGTTLVDGFITYRVTVKNTNDDSKPLMGSVQSTIQGLLLKNTRPIYKWAHEFSFTKIEHKDDYEIKLEIIDARSEANCTLKVTKMGYKNSFTAS